MIQAKLAAAMALWRAMAEELLNEKRLLRGGANRWLRRSLSAAWNLWRELGAIWRAKQNEEANRNQVAPQDGQHKGNGNLKRPVDGEDDDEDQK